jgi:hypothetical protein
MLLFLWPYWNRFIGASSNGWHGYYGHLIVQGKIPYRDFHLYVPPLFPLQLGALEWVFGKSLFPARVFGVIERMLIAALLTLWLRRVFPAWIALWGGVVAAVAFSGDPADALTLHHHGSLLWLVVAGLCASSLLTAETGKQIRRFSCLTGLTIGISLLAKHTTGLIAGMTLAGVTVCVQAVLHGRERAVQSVKWMIAGWCGAVLPALTWLWANGALTDFTQQVILEGPSSKGPAWQILLRPIEGALTNSGRLVLALGAVILNAALLTMPGRREPDGSGVRKGSLGGVLGAAALLGAAISLPQTYALLQEPSATPWVLRSIQLAGVYFGFIGCAILLVRVVTRWRRQGIEAGDAQLLLLSCTSFAAAYALSLSWPVYEVMALPCLGLTTAWYVSAFEAPRHGEAIVISTDIWWARAGRALALTAAGGVLGTTALLKVVEPYAWEEWKEPAVWTARGETSSKELHGFSLAKEVVEFLNENTEALREHAAPGERVVIFPHFPILYTLSGCEAALSGAVHWFDVAPDAFTRREAEKLKSQMPRVVGYLDLGEDVIRRQEKYYRNGHLSGQRDLLHVFQQLGPQYDTVRTMRPPGGAAEFKLMVLKPKERDKVR